MQQEGEPSVEEILASIKNVIARDNRSAAQLRRASSASAAPEPSDADEADDILELADAGEVIDDDDDGLGEDSFDGVDHNEALLGDASADTMRDSLAALAMLAEPGARPQIVRSGETSLEGLVREMLRPMLAQWLDTNLPPMVERMVQAEIARIAGKRR